FGLLVDWSDMERERTGRAGSELRPEALQYLGIAFAYDDWNENAVPDVNEGMPSGIARVQDPNLLPQDREWTPEVYFSLGEVYYEEAKFPEAIEVWSLALERFPMHHRAPEFTSRIAQAQARRTDLEEDLKRLAAGEWRARLGDYGEGSDWWNANVDHPVEQRDAERLATQALISAAVEYHERASQLRRRCAGEGDPEICRRASDQYESAAQAYRDFLRQRPNDPEAYEIQFNLAETLYWSGQYEEAAVEYAAIRDSNLDDTRLSVSARMVVESLERVVEIAERDGRVDIREEPPPPQGEPPQAVPVAMPELLQRLAQARELYIARVSEEDDTEGVRKAYEFNNALLLYAYGYWPQAQERFTRIFDERCTGPLADTVGRRAWLNLNDMAVALNQVDEVERLSRELQSRECTFGETEGIDCTDPANASEPQCLADVQLVNIRYQRAVGVFTQAEQALEAGNREQANRLFEQAAMMLVQAVNDEPDHPEAPLALEKAATALEKVSRFQSAFQLYRRIIDEVGPRRSEDPEQQAELDAIVGYAYFQLAYNANRFFDFDTAVDYYSALADSRRFRQSTDDRVRGWRESALINAAIILEQLQQYRRAADYYDRAEDLVTEPEKKRQASFKKAEMAFKQRAWSNAIRAMREFINRYQGQEGAGELVVEAYWKIAEARQELRQTRDYQGALRDVVEAFSQSGLPAGTYAAELAAEARFQLVDERGQDFEDFSISVRSPRTLEDYISALRARIDAGAQEAESIVNDYNQVLGYRSRAWSVAAYVRQGRVYEQLVQAVLDATRNPVIPSDIARQLRGQPPEAREEVKFTIMDGLEQRFAQSLESAECLALVRYSLASRVGRRAALSTDYTRQATDRLQAYGEERISQCIENERQRAQQAGQSPMESAQAGEFRRAPRGQTPDIPRDVAPPAIPAQPESPQ
ncbi:MAG TPA: tetratricopeptide repeat protein, partial [Polyangiaceae bacterium LLY-WYZ-14_1]|nr:tetratricopeptide repeat protein [Polyangiaceae bacterium LLY-WYZ-14_1]